MSVTYGRRGDSAPPSYARGKNSGGYGSITNGGGHGGDGLCPNPRGGVGGYGGADQHKGNHRAGGSESSDLDKQYHGGNHSLKIERREEMDMEGRGEEDLTTKGIRIHVGGLGESVTSDELCGIFSKTGVEIEAADIIRTKGRSFAYINFSQHSQNSLSKLFNTYNGCVWKGGRLRLEKAKEHYLDRLKREWDEDAPLLNSASTTNDDSNIDNIEPSKKPKKDISSEKKQLRIFFPRLQKVKSVSFNGTGKHKYSFRRVEVPSLPNYFCDCEEHCGPLGAAEEKQTPIEEEQVGGMNKEEIDMMNSVMNKLFEMENVPSTEHTDVQLTKEEDYSVKGTSDLQLDEIEGYSTADEDNLIINVVRQAQETIQPHQDFKLNKKQACNGEPTQPVLKKRKRNHEMNTANEHVSTVSEGKERSQAQLNASGLVFGAQHTESQSRVKQSDSAPSVSWSQKSSWRELVGDRSNTSIKISDIVPGASSKRNEQSQSYTAPNSSNKKKKKMSVHETQRRQLDRKVEGTEEAQPTKTESDSDNGGRDHLDKKVEETEEARPTKMDSASDKGGRNHLEKKAVETEEARPTKMYSASDKGGRDHLDKKVEETEEARPPKMDSASDKGGRDDLDRKVEGTEETQQTKIDSASDKGGRDQLDEKGEVTEEAQPTKVDSASNKGGRGSAWLHKSSWTQLVTSNNSNSFSITQILPGITFDKQESSKLDGPIIAESRDTMSDDLTERGMSESIARDRGMQRTFEPSLPTVGSNIGSASTASKYNLRTKQPQSNNAANGETCTFKRTDASLKEWAKIKAALGGSHKKTSREK